MITIKDLHRINSVMRNWIDPLKDPIYIGIISFSLQHIKWDTPEEDFGEFKQKILPRV